jgi:uncharacterized protein (TIGR03435 family)
MNFLGILKRIPHGNSSRIWIFPAAVTVVGALMGLQPQAGVEAAFEAASIRAADRAVPYRAAQLGPTMFAVQQMSLKDLIGLAYKVQAYQIFGGPQWVDSERYDVRAKAEYPSSREQIRAMMAVLLKQRFQLQLENASQTMAVYALTVSRKRLKLKAAKPDAVLDGVGAIQVGGPELIARGVTMTLLTRYLTGQCDRPVVDRTGLGGGYDFSLTYVDSSESETPGEACLSVGAAMSGIGLRLENRKAEIPILKILQAEHPSGN